MGGKTRAILMLAMCASVPAALIWGIASGWHMGQWMLAFTALAVLNFVAAMVCLGGTSLVDHSKSGGPRRPLR